ncbi:MAG: polysaccharide pyruvyl transferase family protein [Lachnospiraceae bacterium]|nr:polysaccharide pyruvyl transferase family protein [Lachnospiraceae bacterium]
MKIGILTFHGADNFGCVLQCMALQNAIEAHIPTAKVEIINYVMPNLVEKKLLLSKAQYQDVKKRLGKKVARKRVMENLRTLPGRAGRIRKFKKFRKAQLHIAGPTFSNSEGMAELDYDVFIVGSDQVFNLALIKGKEDIFFLEKAPEGAKKISYAASTGHSSFGEPEQEKLRKYLINFDMVSIREKSAQAAIQELANKKVSVCLDPTMLHSAEYWRTLERKPKGIAKHKYVFMYGLGYPFCKEQENEACKLARMIAEKTGMIVIHHYFGDYRKRFDENAKHCYYQGPYEFLWLVDHAEYVVNCSYHGTVFSVIFERPFYTYSTGGNSARMQDLVSTLGIEERYLEKPISEEEIDWDIDWERIRTNWERERTNSLNYLKEAIEG